MAFGIGDALEPFACLAGALRHALGREAEAEAAHGCTSAEKHLWRPASRLGPLGATVVFFLDPSGTPAKSCCVAGKQLLDNNSLCFIPGQGPSIQREQSSRAQLAVVGRYDWKSCTAKVASVMKSALQPFSLLRCRKALREACQHRKPPEEALSGEVAHITMKVF